jgi:hypothetical protein
MRIWLALLTAFLFLAPFSTIAQSDQDMELIREAAKANKKLIVGTNMNLTAEESEKFWPLYEEYQGVLRQLNQRTGAMINDYAGNYENLNDENAESLLNEYLNIEDNHSALRREYILKFSEVLPIKKIARYFQIENKIKAAIDYELAGAIPLVK